MSLDEIKELAGHREVSPWVVKLVQEAVELEREACANVCELEIIPRNHDLFKAFNVGATRCATAIRSRSN